MGTGISTAVAPNRVAAGNGFNDIPGNFASGTPDLPAIIAIFGEANTNNQSGLTTAPVQIISAKTASDAFGNGSPIHRVASILFPQSGGGTAAEVWAYPQLAAGGSVASVSTLTFTGTATSGGVLPIYIAGRDNVSGQYYSINVATGDTPTQIGVKAWNAINGCLGGPTIATKAAGVVTLTAKWTGLTSNDISLSVDSVKAAAMGVTVAIALNTTPGSGSPAVSGSLALIGNKWVTHILSCYALEVTSILSEYETWNGIPSKTNPTGRFDGMIFKPTIAYSGTLADDPTVTTDGRSANCTNSAAVAPLSAGLPMEAAANRVKLEADNLINNPELSLLNIPYPDMPLPAAGSAIPAMCSYSIRDVYVNKGCSTVDIVNGVYTCKDSITTYHPAGELPPIYSRTRDIYLDMEYAYGYKDMESIYLTGKVIVSDKDLGKITDATNVTSPKLWTAKVFDFIDAVVTKKWFTDAAFMKSSVVVQLDPNNPARINTTNNAKRTSVAGISSTTTSFGFNFG